MQLNELAPIAITFVVIAIIITVGSDVLSNIRDNYTAGTASANASGYGLESMEELSSWLPTLAIVIVAAVIIGVIAVYFAFGGGR